MRKVLVQVDRVYLGNRYVVRRAEILERGYGFDSPSLLDINYKITDLSE